MFKSTKNSRPLFSIAIFLAFGFLLTTAGCNENQGINVTGKIVNNEGTPVTRSRVIFRNSDGNALKVNAVTDTEGRYDLSRTSQSNGLLPGNYEVLISPIQTMGDTPASFNLISPKYASFRTSGLEVTVNSEQAVHDFTVESARKR